MARAILSAACLLLFSLVLAACSVRHPTYLPEAELARARVDSLGLDDFLELSPRQQDARTARAADALAPLVATEAAQSNMDTWLTNPLAWTPYVTYTIMPALGDVLEHLDRALGLDPTRADLWLTRGRLLEIAGDERRARQSLAMAWEVGDRLPDRQGDRALLRRNIAVTAAWIERDAGYWDDGLAWLAEVAGPARDTDAEFHLLHGLLLAGRGDLEAAMRVSYGMPPARVPVVSNIGLMGFLGLKREDTDLLRRWLQAEVWLRRGEPDLGWHVLGELPYWRSVVPLAQRFWQDMGLYAEIRGDRQANLYYALSYIRRPYRRSTLPVPLTCDPVILGLPHRATNFFRLESGAFHGGSLVAYAASTTMKAVQDPEGRQSEQRYLLAQEALNRCLRRGVYPDEALALRGRLRFSRGYYVLAEMDLAQARARFAERGETEPWTSYLLGLVAMGRDRPDEAAALLEEALHADRELAGAWNALGVSRLQLGQTELARLALDQAVALAADNHQAWFNRGLLRCQTGDLDGGIDDFGRAARLAPDDAGLARMIQLATLARREGRAFLPGTDAGGNWSAAPVELHTHEDGAFAPRAAAGDDAWLGRLAEMVSENLRERGALARGEGFGPAQLEVLAREYDAEPTAGRRKLLAFGLAILQLHEDARRVLAPHWGGDLDADEVLLLLWLDQRAGENRRLAEMARELQMGIEEEMGDFEWAMMAARVSNTSVFQRASSWGAKYDVTRRSISRGGEWGRYMALQDIRIKNRLGPANAGVGDGRILVGALGRTYSLTGAARGVGSTPRK